MDALCRFLSGDLLCLLTQIYESLGLGSSNSSEKVEAKNLQKNMDNKKIKDKRFLVKDRDNQKTQENKKFFMKNRNNEPTLKEKRSLLKNLKNERVQEEKDFWVVRPSYTIRHNYPGPLKTYDGEERGEPRLIRISDLKSSKVEMILKEKQCEEEQEQKCEDEQESECEVKQENDCEHSEAETNDESQECEEFWASKKDELESLIENLLADRKSSDSFATICSEAQPTPKQLLRKELRARTLYEKSACQNPEAPPWDSLKFTAKLRFHWKAHMGWELQETPFDNFRLGYIKNRRRTCPKMGIRKIRSEMRLRWCNMERRGRLPFILQALLYQVTTGALDPADHCAVREFFQKVK